MDLKAAADSTRNSYAKDVIGNKADAAVTTVGVVASIIAYVKGILTVVGALADSAVSTVGTTASIMSYLKALVSGSAQGAGTVFTIKKTGIVSSTVTQAGLDLTGVSSGGELEILQIYAQTNSTGLAAATLINIVHNNVSGILAFFSTSLASLGANKTVTLIDASTTHIPSVLETGKKLTMKATVADCTGAGTVDVYMTFRRLAAGATIAAA